MSKQRLLILGVTASGKSRLSFEMAKGLGTDIISIDSMKVYKRMDIGTAKPDSARRNEVKYHLIDVVEPWESFAVSNFLELAEDVVSAFEADDKQILAEGGTAMYIKNLLYGLFDGPGANAGLREELSQRLLEVGVEAMFSELQSVDPIAAERIHPNDTKRLIRALEVYKLTGKPISSFQTQFANEPDPRWKVIGLRRPKELESRRINARVKEMVEQGLVDEVRGLLDEEKPLSKQARVAIGYSEIIDYLEGRASLEKAIENIKINTRKLAKAQRTWFKTFRNVSWIDVQEEDSQSDILKKALEIAGM